MPNPPLSIPHVLNDPPPFHQKLLDYGERPYWSADGKRIAFVETNYGDVCELDLDTRKVRNLTKRLGDHHSFLRVLILSNGDYLLIGPKEFKDRDVSRHVESELWVMDRETKRPPVPLGRRIFEGCGVSTIAPRITYAVSGRNDPALGADDRYVCYVTEIAYDADGTPKLGPDRLIYKADGGRRPEPQDFRFGDGEVIMAEYVGSRRRRIEDYRCIVKGVEVATGRVRTYVNEPGIHNECEGIFPDQQYCCLESNRDYVDPRENPTDLWKLALDGSGRRVRMTRMFEHRPWRASNSNVSPDGRWLAFMVNIQGDEAGYGRGLGLMDLAAWEQSEYARQWEVAAVSEDPADPVSWG